MELKISGETILIDDIDFHFLGKYSWHLLKRQGKTTYVRTDAKGMDGKWHPVYLHRLITNAPKGSPVDHINQNGLDCRRENLRVCSSRENCLNQALRKNNTSGHKGVHRRNQKWVAQTKVLGKPVRLGSFHTAKEAAEAYQRYTMANFPAFARFC